MRIVVDASAAISGGKLYLEKLLGQFAENQSDHEFIVFHAGALEGLENAINSERLKFYRIKFPALPFSTSHTWPIDSALRAFWRKFLLPWKLYVFKPDLLFSNAGYIPKWKPKKTKTVIALHNSQPLNEALIDDERSFIKRWRLRLLRLQIKRSLQSCDNSIVFSHNMLSLLMENFGVLQHEPNVIYHGIEWGEAQRESCLNLKFLSAFEIKSPYLLYVSQFHRYKNVIRLLGAFALIVNQFTDLMLVLVGDKADLEYWSEIDEEMTRLNIKEKVVHLPACQREDLIAIYRNATAFVHPSLIENCPFPLLEALAMGLPIAAANLSALPEMAADAAIYFDPYNPEDIADKLRLIVASKDLRNALSQKAIKRAMDFSWQDTASQTLKVFKSICRH